MNTSAILSDGYVEEIDITPDISLMPKLGFSGYSAPQAIGELVDNAIDAMVDSELLRVSIQIKRDSISVADNGSGMNKRVASKALVLAFSRKKDKLGEFGLGMKTACLSLGTYFEIVTTAQGQGEQYHICFDRTKWESSKKGWKVPCKVAKTKEEEHYTIVNIKNLKVFYPNMHNYIREDLKKRYAPFIRAGQVEIKVNGKKCIPEDVALIEGSRKEFDISLKQGKRIYGWYGLLREGSQKGFYGFSTFRRGRMITTYDKVGFDPHPTVARLVGEVHLDHVPVTHNKREFIKESFEYKEAMGKLRDELKDILKQARRKASEETVTEKVRREVEIWKDKIGEALRSDAFKTYTSRLNGIEPSPDPKDTDTVEEVDVEKRKKAEKEGQNPSKSESEKERTPTTTQKKKRHVIRIRGKNIEFTHDFVPLGTKSPWKTYSYSASKSLEIFTNTDFPAYTVTDDKVFYAVLHIAEAISEFFVQIADEAFANAAEIKQVILREAALLKADLKEDDLP
jgi:hypothetical protein